MINTPTGTGARADGYEIRSAAVRHGIPCITTMTGASAAVAGDRRRQRASERADLAAGAARDRRRAQRRSPADGTGVSERVLAPFGRRSLPRSSRTSPSGGYRIFSALDATGPMPRGGPVLHARRERALGRRRGVAALSAAGVLGRRVRGRRRRACGSTSCSRRSAREPRRLAELGEGDALWLTGPLGRPFSEPREAQPASAAGAILVGGGIGIAPLALLRRQLAARGVPAAGPARLPRPRALRRPRALSAARRSATRERGRPRRPPGLRHRPARGDARGRRRRRRGRLRLRPAGDARGGAGDLRRARRRRSSSRWRRRWPAASAPASAARCRCAEGGYMRLCVDGPVVRGDEIETALIAGAGHR